MIVLIEYDRVGARRVYYRQFDDADRQEAERIRLERELDVNRSGVDHEVVLLHAVDEGVLRQTHARYFSDVDEMIAKLRASTSTFVVRERKE